HAGAPSRLHTLSLHDALPISPARGAPGRVNLILLDYSRVCNSLTRVINTLTLPRRVMCKLLTMWYPLLPPSPSPQAPPRALSCGGSGATPPLSTSEGAG